MLGIVQISSSFPFSFSFPNSVENMQVDIRLGTLRVARLLTLGSVAEILYSKQYVTPLISWLAPQTGKMKQVLCFDRPPELA